MTVGTRASGSDFTFSFAARTREAVTFPFTSAYSIISQLYTCDMAPSVVTEDYYAVLEVRQDATSEAITKAYRRLALIHHPDRRNGSTKAFQLVRVTRRGR